MLYGKYGATTGGPVSLNLGVRRCVPVPSPRSGTVPAKVHNFTAAYQPQGVFGRVYGVEKQLPREDTCRHLNI